MSDIITPDSSTETETTNPLFEINEVATSCLFSYEERLRLYDRFGIKALDGVCIAERVYFTRPDLSKVRLGENAWINTDCYLDNSDIIEIEDNVRIGPGVRIITSTHRIEGPDKRSGDYRTLPVRIGKGSWICAGVTILPGVSIAPGCVIGAGAIVSRDTKPNTKYVAAAIREVEELPSFPG